MEENGSVVKISFQGQEKSGTLKVATYNSFMQDAEGCRALFPVQCRVNVRCMAAQPVRMVVSMCLMVRSSMAR